MRATAKGVVGQRLLLAKRQFELWRRGCRGPGRIPTKLWLLAAEAAEELGCQETARQLQVDAARLSYALATLMKKSGLKWSLLTSLKIVTSISRICANSRLP